MERMGEAERRPRMNNLGLVMMATLLLWLPFTFTAADNGRLFQGLRS
jgi:hypothetical protein